MQINKFRLAVAILILAAAVFGLINYQEKITANAIKIQEEQKFLNEWLPENCKCLEKNSTKCSEGFELVGNLCKNDARKIFTNVLKACSKYDCSGVVYNLKNETEMWKINEGEQN